MASRPLTIDKPKFSEAVYLLRLKSLTAKAEWKVVFPGNQHRILWA